MKIGILKVIVGTYWMAEMIYLFTTSTNGENVGKAMCLCKVTFFFYSFVVYIE